MHCAFRQRRVCEERVQWESIVGNDKDVQEIGFLCNGCSRVPNMWVNVELLGSLEKYFICKMKMLFFMNELIVN
jgi:hypothetical protein